MLLPKSGVLCMLLSAVFFSWMALGVRMLAERAPDIHVVEIIFFRAFFTLFVMIFIMKRARLSWFGGKAGLLILRGLMGFVGMTAYYLCLQELPLGAAVTLQQMNPLFASLISFIFLSEFLSKRQLIFIFVAFLGVVLIAQPPPIGGGTWQAFGVTMGIVSAVVAGASYTYARWLTKREPILRIVAWFPLVAMTAACLIIFVPHPYQVNFVMPQGNDWIIIFWIALGTLVGQIYMTEGLRLLEAGPATTVAMLQVVLAVVYDIFILSEMPNLIMVLGVVVIIFSVIQVARK